MPAAVNMSTANTWARKSNISATDPAVFENLTQYDNTPQFWYLTK